jgi:hypothetical protein
VWYPGVTVAALVVFLGGIGLLLLTSAFKAQAHPGVIRPLRAPRAENGEE